MVVLNQYEFYRVIRMQHSYSRPSVFACDIYIGAVFTNKIVIYYHYPDIYIGAVFTNKIVIHYHYFSNVRVRPVSQNFLDNLPLPLP